MKRIGLISDTHGFLDEAVFRHFEKCDEIWHAGDFGNLQVIDRLSAFKKLRGVYGNIDGKEIRTLFPEQNRFVCEGVEVLMIHIGGYPKRYQPAVRNIMQTDTQKLFFSVQTYIFNVMNEPLTYCLQFKLGDV